MSKRKAEPQYLYIGPPAPVLLLPNGYKVSAPADRNGQELHELLQRQPLLKKYYELQKQEQKSKEE